MTPLAMELADRIARQGPMPVADYMRRCLWDEQYGYYATRQPLGRSGDFTTAPEISQIFGELMGLWSAVVWRDLMRAPSPATLAELGPGNGTLMADALRATKKVAGFRSAVRGRLIEASRPLIERQRTALMPLAAQLTWHMDLETIEPPAVILANEFFDALPIRQWVRTGTSWSERAIGLGDGRLCFTTGPTLAADVQRLAVRLADAPDGAICEEPASFEYVEAIGRLARRGPVAALVVDYGHERSAAGDTLQAVRRHAHEHPLTSPGEADLSAQVDFAALGGAALASGLAVDGPISQAAFLGRLGIVERAAKLMAANPAKAAEIESGVARLLAPGGMGSRFKVLGLRSPQLPALPGFEMPSWEALRR